MNNFHAGIDIAKLSFSAAIKAGGKEKTKSFSNDKKGFRAFLKWLGENPADSYRCCMEATGRYGEALAGFLHSSGCAVSVVNPAKISYFMKMRLDRNKTDEADAKAILAYSGLLNPPAWRPQSAERLELRELLQRAEALEKMRQQELNRLELARPAVRGSIKNHIEYLEKEIKSLEGKIRGLIAAHADLKKDTALLAGIPGIGEKTAQRAVAYFPDIRSFAGAKQAAAFCGLAPQRSQSGTSLNSSRLSKTGGAKLRKIFFMPALVAARYNPVIKAFYDRLIANGKPKKKALCAAMRKLVHIIYGVLKSGLPFDPERKKNKPAVQKI
jgi:transposase